MTHLDQNGYPDSDTILALLKYSQVAAKVGGWQLDIASDQLYWTDETYRIHDTSPGEFNPTVDSGVSYFLPESRQIISAALQVAMEQGIGYALELETLTTKGRLINVFTTCEVTLVDGKPSKLTGIFQDITERNRAKAELQKEQLLLQNILASAIDGIILVNRDGEILSFNSAAEKIFLRDSASTIGKNLSILVPEPDHGLLDYIREGSGKVLETGLEFTAERASGERFPLDISITEWFDGEKPLFTLVVRDITAQKRIQAQLIQTQKMESVSQLSGGLAHDFNNLLAIIVGNLDVLKTAASMDMESQSRIDAAMRAVERGEDITRRMLNFSRLQANQTGSLPAQDVNALLREMLKILKHTLGPTYEIDFSTTSKSLWARVDPAEFENVILNLAVNARDAMPNGGQIKIRSCSLELESDQIPGIVAGRWLQLMFSDKGCGIDGDVTERIFEPFFTTKTDKGSGLGLAMAYSFVTQLKGHIRVESEPGKGSRFLLYFPILEGGETRATIINGQEFVGGTESILVVDDEPELLELASLQLSQLGYKTITAADAKSALELLEKEPKIDLVFSDVMLPGGMLGTQLAAMIQQLYPDLAVLLTSGFSQPVIDDNTYTKYAGDILQKPYRLKDLALRVRSAMDESKPSTD